MPARIVWTIATNGTKVMALGLVSIVPTQTRRIVDARAPDAPDEKMEIARATPIHVANCRTAANSQAVERFRTQSV